MEDCIQDYVNASLHIWHDLAISLTLSTRYNLQRGAKTRKSGARERECWGILVKRNDIRSRLVAIALEWQELFGVAPHITSAISELDAARRLVGMTAKECGKAGINRTAVTRGYDFEYRGCRYQIKANRPSGKPGSKARIISVPKNLDWDVLIWILYDKHYVMQEAWMWTVAKYKKRFKNVKRLRPTDMREGKRLYPHRH
jgi:hypothetical protein